jgi:hypothetical protein
MWHQSILNFSLKKFFHNYNIFLQRVNLQVNQFIFAREL